MKVLCVRVGEETPDQRGWLTVDQEYTLLAILAIPGRGVRFRVLADDGRTPILAGSESFAAPVQPVPDSWAAKVVEGGVVELGPPPWLEPGYWERFFDEDPVALAAFEEAVKALSG